MNYNILEEKLNYRFKQPLLLEEALTHSSYAYEHSEVHADNERLEYLGDAVLQLLISSELYRRQDLNEGLMTKLRARVVCEPTLAQVARDINLAIYLKLGHGESMGGGADNDSNLANAVEAILGAVFIDSGYAACEELLSHLFTKYIDLAIEGKLIYDHKSFLLEAAHKENFSVEFKILDQRGPDHDRRFLAGVFINSVLEASSEGKTKKEAEQGAAAAYLAKNPFDQTE